MKPTKELEFFRKRNIGILPSGRDWFYLGEGTQPKKVFYSRLEKAVGK